MYMYSFVFFAMFLYLIYMFPVFSPLNWAGLGHHKYLFKHRKYNYMYLFGKQSGIQT